MKKKAIFSLLLCVCSFGMVTTSCEDMLTPDMERYTEDQFGKDTLYSYFGILKSLQNVAEKNIILGECRGDLVVPADYATDSVSRIAEFKDPQNGESKLVNLADYYNVINQCNFYLQNVDTTLVKYNRAYMKREFAQVQIIRAWTYLNLIRNYQSVPYFNTPINEVNSGVEKTASKVNKENLLEKLLNDGLDKAVEIAQTEGLPDYGTFQTGASNVKITALMTLIPYQLVMGDLYLLRASKLSDYETAATWYHDFLVSKRYGSNRTNSEGSSGSFMRMMMTTKDEQVTYSFSGGGVAGFTSYGPDEIFSIVPSAANSTFGKVLVGVQNIYGFRTSSGQTTTTTEAESDGDDDVVTTSGEISVVADPKYRQLEASKAYENLNLQQEYIVRNGVSNLLNPVPGLSDGRIKAATKDVNTDDGVVNFINKFAPCTGGGYRAPVSIYEFNFRYALNTYRRSQIVLRYAEAINRAGFPGYAFALLKSGLTASYIPTLKDSIRIDTIRNEEVSPTDTIVTFKKIVYVDSIAEGINFIPLSEIRRAQSKSYLDLSLYEGTDGIHAYGCGDEIETDEDTSFSFDKKVAEKIADEQLRIGAITASEENAVVNQARKKIRSMMARAITVADDTIDADEPLDADPIMINAVEDLIVDELALECAFEGYRYYDLMRIAEHKNNDKSGKFSADFGTKWMAWKIARRAYDLKPYENPTQYDVELYNKLLNKSNWYLSLPVYY